MRAVIVDFTTNPSDIWVSGLFQIKCMYMRFVSFVLFVVMLTGFGSFIKSICPHSTQWLPWQTIYIEWRRVFPDGSKSNLEDIENWSVTKTQQKITTLGKFVWGLLYWYAVIPNTTHLRLNPSIYLFQYILLAAEGNNDATPHYHSIIKSHQVIIHVKSIS